VKKFGVLIPQLCCSSSGTHCEAVRLLEAGSRSFQTQ
jgi:hypothetical protein